MGDEKEFEEAMARNPHLREYVNNLDIDRPEFNVQLDRGQKSNEYPNVMYPVGDPIFIHILRRKGENEVQYIAVEPKMTPHETELLNQISDELIKIAHTMDTSQTTEDISDILVKLMNDLVLVEGKPMTEAGKTSFLQGIMDKFSSGGKISMTKDEYDKVKYFLIRERVGYGILEPLLRDPYIEDIHCIGVSRVYTIHKIFELVMTSIVFNTDLQLDKYVFESSERVERPVSEAQPVVDAIMPDGSRVNMLYGREISLEGSSFTIRKFSKVPVSVTQLINWGTFPTELAAYMWLCLENGMSVFICGETASGKTTTLNAMSTFIKPTAKIYSVENTPEVTMPHPVWQHLVTRESGKETDVTMMDLLVAALRSRPNYIIVGEIREKEGNVAFQAMQTGHPVISTFHAGDPHKMIQRVTSHPISVPIAAVDNLNIVLIQQAVYMGTHFVRRVLSVTELIKYYDEIGKVGTATAFEWIPSTDEFSFMGWKNSYIMEEKIARMLGFTDLREIYAEITLRSTILKKMVENKIFNYFDVWEVIKGYYFQGKDALPFRI
ncbi:MAG: type II/IV secretion system ATPase subunit [Candidatus Altiarchaeota archaeon]|nr:type II/IV secretion system ATPase subunit [Candidatus Altiarchaeota archaeon]